MEAPKATHSDTLRAGFYVDGFNLYCGLIDSGLLDCRWLDLGWLCKRLAFKQKGRKQNVVFVKNFTALPTHIPDKEHRHRTYLSAIEARCDMISTYLGDLSKRPTNCKVCGRRYDRYEEKRSDVGIAVELLSDCFVDKVDVVHLISGDSDFIPVLEKFYKHFPEKRIKIWLPPGRGVSKIKEVARAYEEIQAKDIRACQMPNPVPVRPGVTIAKPSIWP